MAPCKVLVSTALAAALAILYFSAPAASEDQDSARVVPIQQCPKNGLCPYVRRIVPAFFQHPGYHQTPAAPHYPHYPPVHPYYPHPFVPPHGGGNYQYGLPPSIVISTDPHHATPIGHAPVSGEGHHGASPHHAERRDEPGHPTPHHVSQHVEASLCGNLCVNDHVCPGEKKCCPTECGYSCFDPVHIAE